MINDSERAGYQIERAHLLDERQILAAYATTLEASSFEGALVQLGCMGALDESTLTSDQNAYGFRFHRLLHSVLRALQRVKPEEIDLIALDVPALGVSRLVGEDPWVPYVRRAAMQEAKRARQRSVA